MVFSKSFGYAVRGVLYIAIMNGDRKRIQLDEIAEKLTGIPKRIPGCSITRLDTLSQLDDERMKRMLQGDEYDRRQYQERKQQYKGQKQRSAAQLTKA